MANGLSHKHATKPKLFLPVNVSVGFSVINMDKTDQGGTKICGVRYPTSSVHLRPEQAQGTEKRRASKNRGTLTSSVLL